MSCDFVLPIICLENEISVHINKIFSLETSPVLFTSKFLPSASPDCSSRYLISREGTGNLDEFFAHFDDMLGASIW